MRRVLVPFVLTVAATAVILPFATTAQAACAVPSAPHVTPASVQAGDTVQVSGTESVCQDQVVNGTPKPNPGPVPHDVVIYLQPKTVPPHFGPPASARVGTVPVTKVAADRTTWDYAGPINVPAATTPGDYVVSLSFSNLTPLRVLPAAQPTPKKLPFTGPIKIQQEAAAGVVVLLVGVLLCVAAGRVRQW